MARWARRLAALTLGGLLLSGFPGGERAAGPVRPPGAAAARPAPQPLVRPVPPPDPAGAADDAPPLRLLATVDLSAARPGRPGLASAAAAGPDGADVLVTPADPALPPSLVRIDPGGTPAGAIELSGMSRAWDAHRLPDGTVLLSGETAGGAGYAVADPRTGTQRTAAVVPLPARMADLSGAGLPAADGRTAYLLVRGTGPTGPWSHLLAVDIAAATVLADHDLTDDVAALSALPLAPNATWLVPGPGGGVDLLFDALPSEGSSDAGPALIGFDAGLVPVDAPGPLTGRGSHTATGAAVAGAGGTLFLTASRSDGAWIYSLPPDRAQVSPLARLHPWSYAYALVVDQWQGWAATLAPGAVLAVNLATGSSRRLGLPCAGQADVRGLAQGPTPTQVLVLGRCQSAAGQPMAWLVGV